MSKPFHMAWFLQGSSVQAWGEPFTGNIAQEWMSAELFKDLARQIERACFDYLLIEDSIYIGETWQQSRDLFLKTGLCVPRQEPTVIATLMAAVTSHLGIVPTLSTFAYAPYLTARIVGSLDQISGGRAGWNAVTGFADLSAQNFGMAQLPDHDIRYEMAEEYVQIVKQLWGSWQPGATVADADTGVLFDPSRVQTIDFQGTYYSSRGPLNSGPCPQGRPAIAQAGGSEIGKRFAAAHADTIVAAPSGIENMKRYRDDIRRLLIANGRDPDSCKVLYLLAPIVAETEAQARWQADQRVVQAQDNIEARLARLGWSINIDFSEFDLDAPVGELSTNGTQSTLALFLAKAGKRTLREAVIAHSCQGYCVDVVGTPESVAQQMGDIMDQVGGDGFLIALPDVSRRSIATIVDGLMPELQRRGRVRRAYRHVHLRDHLMEF